MTPLKRPKKGVGEVAWPIITSTATTLAAFVPLLFWNDIMGEFMKFLPITLIIVLASSLFVALVINPVLTSVYMKIDDSDEKVDYKQTWKWFVILMIPAVLLYAMGMHNPGRRVLGGVFLSLALILLLNTYILAPFARRFQDSFLPVLEHFYQRSVRFALTGKRPLLYFLGTIVLMIASIIFMGASGLQINLFPINQPNQVFVYVEYPVGTDIEKTDAFTKEIEKLVLDALEPYKDIVKSVLGQVGEGTSNPMAGPQQGSSPNKSRVTVDFKEYQYRNGKSTTEAMKAVRKAVSGYPGVQIVVDKDQMGPPSGSAINMELSGENFETLLKLSNDIKHFLDEHAVPGVEELKIDLETGKPELLVQVDRDKARRFGLSTAQIGSTFRTAIFGKEISKYKEGEDDYPIQLRFNERNRYDLPGLLNQKITFRNNQGKLMQIPISAVADVEYGSTYGSIKRIDMDRVVTIYSNVTEGYNGTEIVNQYKRLLSDYDLPEGYNLSFTGEQEQQQESMAFLSRAMLIAVFLIFLILVMQFNSISTPFIVITSVLFSTIGVFLGYGIFRMDFIIIMTGIGIISLAGVVVNNAIVLLDYINLVRNRQRKELGLKEGESQTKVQIIDAIVEAGSKRLRPVLLTAITTVLGLIPLATGMNIDFAGLLSNLNPNIYFGGDNAIFWGPMAWTVIFGLIFATFLTLIIVPVMYLLVDRLSVRYMGGGISGRRKTKRAKKNLSNPDVSLAEG